MPGTLAHQALLRIGALYAIEKDIRGKPADERCRQRQSRSRPLIEALHRWLHEALGQLSAKSPMALALGYSLNHWHALTRFVDDGHIEMDNNAAERALRAELSLGARIFCTLARTPAASAPPSSTP